MRSLLDVNVLIAILDAGHIMHNLAINWLAENGKLGWATCPITQNGAIRIMSQPAYPSPKPAAQVAIKLQELCSLTGHNFWSDSVNMLDDNVINWQNILGHRQMTDAYLLALAIANKGKFISFDKRININLVVGAKSGQFEIIG